VDYMSLERQAADNDREPSPASLFPETRSEFITLMAHYHRAEIARMAGWRDRIDLTTNWAITAVAAMLSLSLSTPTSHHGVLLFSMLVVLLLLVIEARRYRFFDVYRSRVRQMERNYYAQMFAPTEKIDADWVRRLGEDLRAPLFLISLRTAMSRRLRRNYCWIFLILLLAWVVKITSQLPQTAEAGVNLLTAEETVANAALGPAPGWLIIAIVVLFYGWVLYATLRKHQRAGELVHGEVHF
jgi:uncharacterized membrane protein